MIEVEVICCHLIVIWIADYKKLKDNEKFISWGGYNMDLKKLS